MPIAHACPGCGQPLAHIRAAFVHDLQAPVVVCPGCALAAVRRRHPITIAIRLWWCRLCSLYGLAWRGFLTFMLAISATILAFRISDELDGAGIGPFELGLHLLRIRPDDAAWDYLGEAGGRIFITMGACWAVLAGTIITGGLAHLRKRWIPWLLFLGLVILFIWTPALYSNWARLERAQESQPIFVGGLSYNIEAASATRVFLALIPVMLLGIPLGMLARRAILRRDVGRWTRKRAFLRARKTTS